MVRDTHKLSSERFVFIYENIQNLQDPVNKWQSWYKYYMTAQKHILVMSRTTDCRPLDLSAFYQSCRSHWPTIYCALLPSHLCEHVLRTCLEKAPDFRHIHFEHALQFVTVISSHATQSLDGFSNQLVFLSALRTAGKEQCWSEVFFELNKLFHRAECLLKS